MRSIISAIGRALPESRSAADIGRLTQILRSAGDDLEIIARTRPGVGGTLAISRIADSATGAVHEIVTKSSQGAAEVAGSALAQILGIDHLVPVAVQHGTDGARMLRMPGIEAEAAAVRGADMLVVLRRARLARVAPHLDSQVRGRVARMEIELAQSLDYLLANGDRHARNVLVDTASGHVSFIDFGASGDSRLAARYVPGGGTLVPKLDETFQGAGRRVALSADTLEWIRSRLSDDVLRSWHAAHPDISRSVPIDEVLARFHSLIDEGGYSYVSGADAAAAFRIDAHAGLKHYAIPSR